MEFPLILIPAVRDGDPEPFESLIEQIEVAEELGYDVPMDEVEQRFSEALDILGRAWTEERFAYDNLGMFGTPDAVAEKVRWMRDGGGVGQLMSFMGLGGPSQEKVLRNMRIFTEEVTPRFKRSGRSASVAQGGAARA